MSDVANRIKAEIIRRIDHLEKEDEEHMNKIMKLEDDLTKEKKKRNRVAFLLDEAKEELNKVDDYIKFANEMYGE